MDLLKWRTNYGFGKLEALILVAYSAILSYTIYFHEAWSDEAQAWVLARDNSFWQLFRHRLHYEGTPAEWHFILRFLYLIHVPWGALGWAVAVFPVAGIYVLLRYAPFPLPIRILLPFTFFFLYQYAAIARSYVLFPLLVFSLCAVFTSRRPRIIWFAVVAGLLANLCFQGFLVSVIFTLLYVAKMRRYSREEIEADSRDFDGSPLRIARFREDEMLLVRRRSSWTSAALIYACLLLFAAYTAMPAPDVGFAVGDQVSTGIVHRILVKVVGESPRMLQFAPPARKTLTLRPVRVRASLAVVTAAAPRFFSSPKRWVAWHCAYHPGGNTIIPILLEYVVGIASEMTWPVATSNALACAFLLVVALWMQARHELPMLLPWIVLMFAGAILWVADHHAGMILITLLAGIWIAAKEGGISQYRRGVESGFTLLLTLVVALQVMWSFSSIRKDLYGAYSPGPAVAYVLLKQPAGSRMAAFHFYSVAVQPYFAHNPFFNLPAAGWEWNSNVDRESRYKETIAARPDVVLYTWEASGPGMMRNQWVPLNPVSWKDPSDPILEELQTRGYTETHRFCGDRYSRRSISYHVCDLIFQPEDKARAR